jgi:hypothetical protein
VNLPNGEKILIETGQSVVSVKLIDKLVHSVSH